VTTLFPLSVSVEVIEHQTELPKPAGAGIGTYLVIAAGFAIYIAGWMAIHVLGSIR